MHIRKHDGTTSYRKQVAHSECHAIRKTCDALISEGIWQDVRGVYAPEGTPQSGSKRAERKRRSEAQKERRRREIAEWDPFD